MYLFQVAALLVEGSLCQEDADSVREKSLDKLNCTFCPYQQSESVPVGDCDYLPLSFFLSVALCIAFKLFIRR